MGKGRLEAFSDGVIAIIITIMVLQLQVPDDTDIDSLKPLIHVFISYALSFIYVGIYWNNHHHMFQAAKSINGSLMWSNLFLLFCLSIIPFVTEWMGENQFAKWPIICYGAVLIITAIAYAVLTELLIRHHGKDSLLANAFEHDLKGKITIGVYAAAIAIAFIEPWVSLVLYFIVACMWIIPDKRIERKIIQNEN